MVVWLRHADVDVGVIDGVVPREAFEQFASLADAAQRLETMRAQRLAQAEDAARLTLRLHPADRAAAERALAAAPQPWLAGLAVALEDDASLAPGSCRCESSTGWLDASLEVQLEAVGRVAARSLDAPVRALAPDEEAGP